MRALARPSAAARAARTACSVRTFSSAHARAAPAGQTREPEAQGKAPYEQKSTMYLARPLPSLSELRATPLTEAPTQAVIDTLEPSFTAEPGPFFDERFEFVGGRGRPPLSTFFMRDPYYQEMMLRTENLLEQVQHRLEVRGILRARELPQPPEEKYRRNTHWVDKETATARLAGAKPGEPHTLHNLVELRRFQFVSLLDRLKDIARYLPYLAPGGVLSGLPPPFGQEAHPSTIGQDAANDKEIGLSKQLLAVLDQFAAPTTAMGQARKARFNIELNAPQDPDVQVVRNQPNPGAVLQARPPEQRFAKMWTMDVSGRIHASGGRKSARAAVWIVPSRLRESPGRNGMSITEYQTPTEQEGQEILQAHEGAAETVNDFFEPLPAEHMIRPMPDGVGTILVNGVLLGRYFNGYRHTSYVQRALSVLGLSGAFNVYALVSGGGATGQAGAVAHALAKSLVGAAQVGWITTKPPLGRDGKPAQLSADQQAKAQAELAAKILAVLRKDGILRRDPRMPERKKTGKPGARASNTWVKR